MTRRTPAWGGALFFGASGLSLLAAGFAWLALYPALPRDLGGAQDLDGHAEHVRIAVDRGEVIDGWHVPSRNGSTLLLLHGYARTHAREWRYGDFLSGAGYGLLAIDFRSSREENRKPTTLGAYELPDAEAALAWLREVAPHDRLGLFGESLGGSVGLVLAARHPEIDAVVTDCAFATGRLALEESCERWMHVPRWPAAVVARWLVREVTGRDPAALDALSAARLLRDRPLFIIHSMNDDRFSTAQAEALWRAAGADDSLWLIPGAGHNEGWTRERAQYEARVLQFFGRHLRAGRPS